MKQLTDWLLSRLQEQSTWRGIVLLLTSLGVAIDPDKGAAIIAAGLSIVGLINVFRNEKKAVGGIVNAMPPDQPKP